ncbi:MAG: serpin family protein [Eubacteriales bacterium]|nr:serpin family protein [Eubacteriales bacterium]
MKKTMKFFISLFVLLAMVPLSTGFVAADARYCMPANKETEAESDKQNNEAESKDQNNAEADLDENNNEETEAEGQNKDEAEEVKMPELKALNWVLEKPNETEELPDNWFELTDKFSENVAALGKIMEEELDDLSGFSPLSLYLALMAFRPGLSPEAQATLDEKLNPAGLSEEEIAEVIRILNTLAVRYAYEAEGDTKVWESNTFALGNQSIEFAPEYLEALKANGMAALQADLHDEETYKELNALISYYTKGLIDPLYSDDEIKEKVKDDILNILINSIYFRAAWSVAFDPDNTTDETFYGQSGEKEVPMMQGQPEDMPYLETEDYVAIKKPYQGGAAMLILMPKQEVSEKEYWDFYAEAKASEDWSMHEVVLSLPKWELSSQFDLGEVAGALGLDELLQNGKLGFFTQDDLPLEVGNAFQRVELRVNEEGTEAAVVTVIETKCMAMPVPNPQKIVVVDHPFIYSIEDQNISLLQGLVVDMP